jgi:hypothetical protein
MTQSFDRDLARGSAARLKEKRSELSELAIPPGRGWHPRRDEMAKLLGETPDTIGAVITMLQQTQAILDELPPSQATNRVSAFNSLYLTITKRVAALDQWNRDEEDTPDVWEVLFKRAGDERLSRLVAAMLGVNAHINHDLSLALIATWNEVGPPTDDLIHPDYLLINQIFYEEIPPLRRDFSTTWQLDLDEFVGPLDDWSQRVLVRVTRAHAWDQARHLWELRDDRDDFEQARRTMDRAASLLGEWVIVADRVVNDAGTGVTGGWHLLHRIFGRDQGPA